jgi:hypothetical protein
MSATPSERETGIKTNGREQFGSVEATSRAPGSRSLEAGGEFLKALASDLTAVVSRLRLWLIAEYRRTGPPRASALHSILGEPVYGRIPRFLRIALLGLLSGSTVVLVAVMLWVLYGSPTQPRSSNVHIPGRGSQPEVASRSGVSGHSKSQELRSGTLRASPGRRPGCRAGP